MGVIGRQRYFQECCYLSGKEMEELEEGMPIAVFIRNVMLKYGWAPGQPIYADHDPEMILQLRKVKLPVKEAKKGKGSKIAGISKMREYECFYMGANFEKEIINYKYVTVIEQVSGKEVTTNEPADGNDHLCDSARYACYTDSFVNKNNIS